MWADLSESGYCFMCLSGDEMKEVFIGEVGSGSQHAEKFETIIWDESDNYESWLYLDKKFQGKVRITIEEIPQSYTETTRNQNEEA